MIWTDAGRASASGRPGWAALVAAAYIEETGADIAFENGGGIRTGRILEKGDITYRDIIDTAPLEITS